MRLPEEQLRYPVELIQQGYEPNYLATYRPDELGGIDVETLARLKRSVEYEVYLAEHKEKVFQALQRDHQVPDGVAGVLEECTSISQVDAIARSLRGKKNAKTFAEANPAVEALGQAILMVQGEHPPADLNAWVAEQSGVSLEEAPELLATTKRWLQLLLCEEAKLMLQLQRAVLKNAQVSIAILPEPAKGEDPEQESESARGATVSSDSESKVAGVATESLQEAHAESTESLSSSENQIEPTSATEETAAVNDSTAHEESVHDEVATIHAVEADTEATDTEATNTVAASVGATAETTSTESAPTGGANEAPVAESAAVAPLIEQFHKGRKQNKGIRTKSLSDKQLSPRQRRRRWLRSILESYSKLKKPLRALTPYQVLMFSRGIRSRIIELNFQQDLRPLIHACRESLSPGRHAMHGLLMDIAEASLKDLILPRLHQDVIAILEEDANQELIEASVLNLQTSLLQRPVRGHRVLLIDAVGLKTAAIAIVDAEGQVLATSELPCNSSKPDVVAQNMSLLGQLVHEYQVTLIAMSNGVARRYLVHSVVELLKQSEEGTLFWTLVDRAGSDAYTLSRTSLVELPRISKRHRAAVWLAWRMQDPLRQILKIDPARMRLGSYQRELPQSELEAALQESVSATLTKAGVDVFSVDVAVLQRIPGMTEEAAKRVAKEREQGTITNRESLMQCLRESLTEMQARQAIGFLRVYGSDNPLDGTIIHPDDYRLAERLVAHAELAMPASAPEGWNKPDYEQIAAAMAAVANLALEGTLPDSSHESSTERPAAEINPHFGVVVESSDAPDGATGEDPATGSGTDEPSDTLTEATELPSSVDVVANEAADLHASGTEDASSSDAEVVVAADAPADETPAVVSTKRSVAHMPDIPTQPMSRPTLSVDAEKLARSWQVGRAKLKSVASSLQFPFADSRDFQFPLPLRSNVPKLETLPQGTMLSALVIGVADFGVFVELGPECSGLIHISRLASDFVEDPHQFVQVGDVVPVWVVSVDAGRKRVSLTAIPPGSPDRKQSSGDGESQSGRTDDSRNRRPERSGGDNRGENRGGDRSSGTGRAPAAGSSTGGSSRPTDNSRNRRDAGRPGGGSSSGRGGYAGSGKGNRSRRDDDRGSETTDRRPVRIDRPQPQKPITEAMQQGKEPLRSFGDLMQFMKTKPTEAEEAAAKKLAETASEESPVIESDNAPSSEPKTLESDANSTA